MNPNRLLAFAALGLTCVAAAAGGGYLASRQNATSEPTAAASTSAAPEEARPAVQETEALISEIKPATEAAPLASAEAVGAPPPERRPAPPARSAPRPARRAEATTARSSEPPPLERTWPSSAASPADPPPSQSSAAEPAPEPARAPEPPREPEKTFEELVVSANSVVGLQLDTAVTSDRAVVEDRVEARVVRDILAGNEVAIPAGSRALGSVMLVERGGKFKDRARLGIRFHTLVLADGTRLPITSETIYRYGDAPGNASAAKIGGGAVAGAIVGAIIGGAKGAAVGATAGAGGGTAAVMAGDAKPAAFPSGTEVTARILTPVTVTVER